MKSLCRVILSRVENYTEGKQAEPDSSFILVQHNEDQDLQSAVH